MSIAKKRSRELVLNVLVVLAIIFMVLVLLRPSWMPDFQESFIRSIQHTAPANSPK